MVIPLPCFNILQPGLLIELFIDRYLAINDVNGLGRRTGGRIMRVTNNSYNYMIINNMFVLSNENMFVLRNSNLLESTSNQIAACNEV